MQGHKKKFRKSLWLKMAFNGEWGTETTIALTTTTTFTTTTALSTNTTIDERCYKPSNVQSICHGTCGNCCHFCSLCFPGIEIPLCCKGCNMKSCCKKFDGIFSK